MQTTTRSTPAATVAHSSDRHHQHLLAAIGPSLRAGAVANRLGVPVAMVEHLRGSNRLLAIPHSHGYLYPTCQFDGRGMLSGMMPVLMALANHDAWERLSFLLTANPFLVGQRPLDALQHGEINAVLDAARRWSAERTA